MTPFITRRVGLAALTLALLAASGVQAQDYPTKPIRLLAPFPAGSGPDANAREIAGELTKILGQTVIVDNKPGASGIIGTDAAAKAAPDGLTIGLAATATGLFMMKKVQTPFFTRDPYILPDTTWGLMYVAHGAAGVALVGLTMAHVYFAIRPEKLWLTKSMLFGFITRRQYLEHHDPARWRVPGSQPVGGRPSE